MEVKLMEEKIDKESIAVELQENIKAEADAIRDYNILLGHVRESNLPKSQIERIEAEVYEIIGDELNHQDRLKTLYSAVSGIKENKD